MCLHGFVSASTSDEMPKKLLKRKQVAKDAKTQSDFALKRDTMMLSDKGAR